MIRSPGGGGGSGAALTANSFTDTQTVTKSIAATSTDGVVVQNTTAAAAGAQQWSPRLRLTGQGWKTTATAASQAVDWIAETVPVQGTTAPTSNLVFSSQINAGGYTNRFQLASDGTATFTAPVLIPTGTSGTGASLKFGGTNSGFYNAGSDLYIQRNTTAVIAFLDTAISLGAGRIYFASSVGGGDAVITRGGAAATIQLGDLPSATPVAHALQGQPSRSGTDTNVGGANLTVRSGTGTGTGTLSGLILQSPIAVASGTGAQTNTTGLTIHNGTFVSVGYTVATLPAAPSTGARAHVTDATAPTYLGALTGGGAVVCPVFYNGSAWVSA